MTRDSAVLLDMGGIVYVTPFERMDEVAARAGVDPALLPRGPFDPAGDADYADMDAGRIVESEYWARASRRLASRGIDIDFHRILRWDGGVARPEVVAAMATLVADHRVVLLTNDATAWMGPGWWDTWDLRHLADAVVDSAEVGIRKPDPAIYLRAAKIAGVPPQRCLFVDDLHVNVAAAVRLGMAATWFDVTRAADSAHRMVHAASALGGALAG